MKKSFIWMVMICIFLFAGCGSKSTTSIENSETTEPYTYRQNTTEIELPKNIQPYRIDYEENGLFYFQENPIEGGADILQEELVFCYQEYSDTESKELCRTDQYVNAFCGKEESEISMLIASEETVVNEFIGSDLKHELQVDGLNNQISGVASLYRLPSDEYAITYKNNIYLISDNGKKVKCVTVEGNVSKLITVRDEIYAYVYGDEMKSSFLKVDFDKCQVENVFDLEEGIYTIFSFDDRVALIYQDKILLTDTDGENKEQLLDLNAHAIFASQIEKIVGTKDAFKIIIDDIEESQRILCMSMTKMSVDDEIEEKVIVRVVVPADYYYDIEFHAKKYNQVSDNSTIEVERIEESLEDYLGKGKRPDIIMFHDNTEVYDYVQKNILTDLNPLMMEQGDISLQGIVPFVKDMISDIDKEKTCVLATNFELLLMASDGTEYSDGGTCNITDYLEWFDQYLTDMDLTGTCNTEQFLYALLPDYFNEKTGETKFTQDEFKTILKSFKTMRDHHSGELDIWEVVDTYGRPAVNIVNAPNWYNNYSDTLLRIEACSFVGIPVYSGNSRVYARLDSPMGILETSSCKEEAYDFISYYILLNDYLTKGWTEDMYGDEHLTKTRFSILQRNLDECILETDKPYKLSLNRVTMEPENLYYTEANLNNLRSLLDAAIPITKAQNDIFTLLLEEMEAYFVGDKDLESACEVFDSRARLYLLEKQ